MSHLAIRLICNFVRLCVCACVRKLHFDLGSAFCPSVVLQQGGHFDFVCSGANVFSTVSFAKDGNPIDFNVTTKYSKNYILLRINSLATKDSAVYTCTAVFGGQRTDFCNNLTVNVKPMAKPVIYTTSPKRLVLRKGSPETLVCHSPSATIVLWYKDGKPLKSSAHSGRILWNNTSQKLHFLAVLPEDSANYSCEAVNQKGASWKHFERIVQGNIFFSTCRVMMCGRSMCSIHIFGHNPFLLDKTIWHEILPVTFFCQTWACCSKCDSSVNASSELAVIFRTIPL